MNNRFLIVNFGCETCRVFLKAVSLINLKLPPSKKIQIIDHWSYENFGVELFQVGKKFDKDGLREGYPFCYIDEIIVEPDTKEVLRGYLTRLLKEDFIN